MKKVILKDTHGFTEVAIDLKHPKRSKRGYVSKKVVVEHAKKPRGKHRRQDVITAGNINRDPIEVRFGTSSSEAVRLEPGEFYGYKVPHRHQVDAIMWRPAPRS